MKNSKNTAFTKCKNVTHSPLNYSTHFFIMHLFCFTYGRRVNMITIEVGNRIRFLRKQAGLSQEKLALKAGIDRTYLAGIEAGKRNATLVSLEKIVVALDISMKEFWDF